MPQHMSDLTNRSFEILFPLVEPGGLYITDDSAWSHWSEFHAMKHPWITRTPLTKAGCRVARGYRKLGIRLRSEAHRDRDCLPGLRGDRERGSQYPAIERFQTRPLYFAKAALADHPARPSRAKEAFGSTYSRRFRWARIPSARASAAVHTRVYPVEGLKESIGQVRSAEPVQAPERWS